MPFEATEHDGKLWIPEDARARIEKQQAATVMIDNRTELPDEALESFFMENTGMFGFGREVRYMSYPAEGTMMARSKWTPPRNVIEEIVLARDMAERDDDVRGAIGAIIAAAYHGGFENQHEDEHVEHTFAEMSEDIGLMHVLHEMHRELLISAQINTVTVFTRQSYDIRPENVSRVITRSVAAPMIGVLPAERIRVLGNDFFGEGQLCYLPDGQLAEWLRQYFSDSVSPAKKRQMRLEDPLAAALFIAKAQVPWNEWGDSLLSTGMDLYVLNPEMVQRSTMAKGSWRYPRPLLTADLPLLEAKRLLNVMDHALLQGGINYIVVAKKGDKDKPATQPEITNLQGLVQRASRSGVLIGDHRINLEIVQPDLKALLDPEKRRMIGRKLSQLLLRVPEFGSDETGNAVQTFTELAQAVITDDRNLVIGHVHRYIWRACMKRNQSVFSRNDRPLIWTPKVILQGLDFWTQYLLKLYDRGDLPRKYMVAFGGYDYDAVKAQKQREVENDHDAIFAPPPVPYSAPGQQGTTPNPYQYGNPSGTPAPRSTGAPDNGPGRPRGSRNSNGAPPDRVRPTRVVQRNRGETVRASWNEDEDQVVRIGEITERVLGEYPDAVLGRVTPAERAALDAGQTTNSGNVIVVPVNAGYQVEDVQAVRLAENFSMLCGHRVPDGAIVAAAFCFREPAFSVHQAEDMIVRWGFPVAIAQSLPEDDDLPIPSQQPIALHLTINGTEVEVEGKGGVEPGKYVYLKCPECGLVQDAAHSKCSRCGHDLTEARKGMFASLEKAGKKPTLHSTPPPPASEQPDLRKG